MPTKKGTKAKNTIFKSAYKLFTQKGYEQTTYSIIAAKCSYKSAAIQYHYPEKDTFLDELLFRIYTYIKKQVHASACPNLTIFQKSILGLQIFYAYLKSISHTSFAHEVIQCEPLRNEYIIKVAYELAENSEDLKHRQAEEFVETYIMTFGGYLDLFCFHMSENRLESVSDYASNHINTLSKLLPDMVSGITGNYSEKDLFSDDELDIIMKEMHKELLKGA